MALSDAFFLCQYRSTVAMPQAKRWIDSNFRHSSTQIVVLRHMVIPIMFVSLTELYPKHRRSRWFRSHPSGSLDLVFQDINRTAHLFFLSQNLFSFTHQHTSHWHSKRYSKSGTFHGLSLGLEGRFQSWCETQRLFNPLKSKRNGSQVQPSRDRYVENSWYIDILD